MRGWKMTKVVESSGVFTVGGKLAVAAKQPAGVYKGNFTVAVEYQ